FLCISLTLQCHLGCSSSDSLFGANYNATTCDIVLIKHLSRLISDMTMIPKMRGELDDTRDRQYENAILFIQQCMLYREFSNTIEIGDTGMIKNLSFIA